jgi:hypothetical protein
MPTIVSDVPDNTATIMKVPTLLPATNHLRMEFLQSTTGIISTSTREQLAVATAIRETQTETALNGKEGTAAFSLL